MRRHSTGKTDVAWTSINFLKYVGPGWPSAGYTKVDRGKGKVLKGKLLTPRFAPAAFCSEGASSKNVTLLTSCID